MRKLGARFQQRRLQTDHLTQKLADAAGLSVASESRPPAAAVESGGAVSSSLTSTSTAPGSSSQREGASSESGVVANSIPSSGAEASGIRVSSSLRLSSPRTGPADDALRLPARENASSERSGGRSLDGLGDRAAQKASSPSSAKTASAARDASGALPSSSRSVAVAASGQALGLGCSATDRGDFFGVPFPQTGTSLLLEKESLLSHPALSLRLAALAGGSGAASGISVARQLFAFLFQHALRQPQQNSLPAHQALDADLLPEKTNLIPALSVAALPSLLRRALTDALCKSEAEGCVGARPSPFFSREVVGSLLEKAASPSPCVEDFPWGLALPQPLLSLQGRGAVRSVAWVSPRSLAAFLILLHSQQQAFENRASTGGGLSRRGVEAASQQSQFERQRELYEQHMRTLQLQLERKHQHNRRRLAASLEQHQRQEAEIEAMLSEPTAKVGSFLRATDGVFRCLRCLRYPPPVACVFATSINPLIKWTLKFGLWLRRSLLGNAS